MEQQELKSYNLLSHHTAVFYEPNDPGWKDMWYIVSVTDNVSYHYNVLLIL